MSDQPFPHAAEAALPPATCSAPSAKLFTLRRFGWFVTADLGPDAWWSVERKSGAKQTYHLAWFRLTSTDGITFSQIIAARLRLRWGRLNQQPNAEVRDAAPITPTSTDHDQTH